MIQPEQNLLFTDQEKNLTMNRIIKTVKTVVFIVGVDVLGFPLYHRHYYNEYTIGSVPKSYCNSKFFKAFSKN